MLNFNGQIVADSSQLIEINRGFLYGDALFDTLAYRNTKLNFIEQHYFRLLSGMRQLRMEIPSYFTQKYWETEILKTIAINHLKEARVRTTFYRDFGGLYAPKQQNVSFIIEVSALSIHSKKKFSLGVYKDNYINDSSINNIKTNNRLINVLAAIYANENNYDTCLLLNHKKQIAETTHANIFLVFGNLIKTPALSEGCIKGVIRERLIELIKKSDYQLLETEISPYELTKADEVFISNSIIEIQAITHYKKKEYASNVSRMLKDKL
jgi:branched-chain amino acid aminotransferase